MVESWWHSLQDFGLLLGYYRVHGLANIEQGISTNSDTVTALQKTIDTQQKTIYKLEERLSQLENKQCSHNLVVEGLKENNNEDVRDLIDRMFADMEVSFNVEWCDSIYRMGVKRQGPSRRLVKVVFPFIIYKNAVLRNAFKLKDQQKWKGVFILRSKPS